MPFQDFMEEWGVVVIPIAFLAFVIAMVRRIRDRRRRKLAAATIDHLSLAAQQGLPLGPALVALAKERADWVVKLRDRPISPPGILRDANTLRGLAESYERSGSLATALGGEPAIFSPDVVDVVRAGENAGALPQVLEALRTEAAIANELSWRLWEILAYPAGLLVVVAGLSQFLNIFIVPKFKSIFESMNVEGPPLEPADFAGFVLVSSTLAMVTGEPVLRASRRLRRLGARLAWSIGARLPLVRSPVRRLLHARWMARAAALLGAGATLTEALEGAARTSPPFVGRDLERAAALAREGHPLADVVAVALGKEGALRAPLLLAAEANGLPAALERTAARLSERAIVELGIRLEALRPLPILAIALLVAAHAWTLWGSIMALQSFVIQGANG